MIKMTHEEVVGSQELPGGLTITKLGLRYSKAFNALMIHTPYISTIYHHEERQVIFVPFYINNIPVWHHIYKDEGVEVHNLW